MEDKYAVRAVVGTEPKVKVYILANGQTQAECDEKVSKYSVWAESLKG